jgi:hypothetical protein
MLFALAALAGAALGAERLYRRHLREPVLNWGATPEEASRRMPGDDLLDPADIVATRAIEVDAPPSAIWPWLVQMGPGRGGAYTYDWIENLLGLNMHSADRIVPEWQQLEVGDVLRSREDRPGMRVEILEPERVLSNRSEAGDWVWTFVLERVNGATRLISRNRIAMKGAAAGQRLGMLVMEPGSLVMERKMLQGIKERAERLAADAGDTGAGDQAPSAGKGKDMETPDRDEAEQGEGHTTSPDDPTHEATTPPGNPDADDEAVREGEEGLDHAGGGH